MAQEYEQTLKSNLEEINRMSQIVEDLLLLSKADSGEIRLNKEDMNLNEILNEVVAHVNVLAQSKNLRIETSNHHEEIHIFGDPLRIRELFLNLIENGIKYTEEGGSIHILLTKDTLVQNGKQSDRAQGEQAEFVKIIVSDTGIGIAKEDQERIFDRFFRVDKAREEVVLDSAFANGSSKLTGEKLRWKAN
jgi:two-component system phosphate regulon sensor histidine kinase PhoR